MNIFMLKKWNFMKWNRLFAILLTCSLVAGMFWCDGLTLRTYAETESASGDDVGDVSGNDEDVPIVGDAECDLPAPELHKISLNEEGKPVLSWEPVDGASDYFISYWTKDDVASTRKIIRQYHPKQYENEEHTAVVLDQMNIYYTEVVFTIYALDEYNRKGSCNPEGVTWMFFRQDMSLKVGLTEEGEALLEWSEHYVKPHAEGYVVFRSENGTEYKEIDRVKYDKLKEFSQSISNYNCYYKDSTVAAGNTYSYKVAQYVGEYTDYVKEGSEPVSLSIIEILDVSTEGKTITVEFSLVDGVTEYGFCTVYNSDEHINPMNTSTGKCSIIDGKGIIKFDTHFGEEISAVIAAKTRDDNWYSSRILSAPFHTFLLKGTSMMASRSLSSKQVGLTWRKDDDSDGYEIYRFNKSNNQYELIQNLKGKDTLSYIDKGRKAKTKYTYKIRSYKKLKERTCYSDFSDAFTVLTQPSSKDYKSVNDKVKKGAKAVVKSNNISLKGSHFGSANHTYWVNVSKICDFIDYKGYYTICYDDDNYLYIQRIAKKDLKVKKTFKMKKKMPYVGGVVGDSKGNYYVAWGRSDTYSVGNVNNFAISKYTYAGKHKKTTQWKSFDGDWDTREAFAAGNCAMTISGNVLVCNYAKHMYNGHQATAVVNLNIKTMKPIETKDYHSTHSKAVYYAYTSHAFDQRVIPYQDGFVFAELGDAYPRAEHITFTNGRGDSYEDWDKYFSKSYETFSYFGKIGENATNSTIGDLGAVSTGVALCGTSGKSAKNMSDPRNVYVQILNVVNGTQVISDKARKGANVSEANPKDKGILWLTSYSGNEYADSVHLAVMENETIIVMWEKHSGNGGFQGSYYAVISSTGKILQKTTPMGDIPLNKYEELKYYKGYVYWTSYDMYQHTATLHSMKIGQVK